MLSALEAGSAYAIAFSSGSAATATIVQAMGPNAHVLSVNDVYGGTFRYLKRVASETQALEVSFVDLENTDDDAILEAFQSNTKVRYFSAFYLIGYSCRRAAAFLACLDRVPHEPHTSARGYTPDHIPCTITPVPATRGRRQHIPVSILPVPYSSRSRYRRTQSHKVC